MTRLRLSLVRPRIAVVTTVHELSRQDARRIAVRAQMLDADRPTDLQDVVRQLTLLQVDHVQAVAPSADLVAWSRMGSAYAPAELRAALAARVLVELQMMVRPAEDLSLYLADMAAWPGTDLSNWQDRCRDWVAANDACRRDVLHRLEERAAARARPAGHLRAAVGLVGVEQPSQRRPTARDDGGAR